MKSLNEIAVVVQARNNSARVPQKMSQGINDYPFASTSLLDIVLGKLTESKVIKNEHIYLSVHEEIQTCLLYTSPSPRDGLLSRMPSSA